MVVVDTDILIWILRGDLNVKEKFKATVTNTGGEVYITPVQAAEIYSGMRPKEREATESFMESLPVLALDGETGKLAGEFIRNYGKSHNVTLADAFIAASVKARAFTLWTLNKKHYPMLSAKEFFEA